MGITIEDIRRAISADGDVAAWAEIWHQALGHPPLPTVPRLSSPVALPDASVLLKSIDVGLSALVAAWAGRQGYPPPSAVSLDIALVGLTPDGGDAGSYLAHILDEVRPDIIALDTSPIELSANMLYAFSLPCAVGLPSGGSILSREGGQFYATETFSPGNMTETAIIKSWRAKIPLLPVGVPQLEPRFAGMDFEAGYVDESYMERETSRPGVLTAYQTFAESLRGVTRLEDGARITRDICHSLLDTMGGKMREVLVEDACYLASRIWELAAYAANRGQPARVLALVDITHYLDVEYVIGLLRQGITDEVYVPPKGYTPATALVLAGGGSDKLGEPLGELASASNLTQELFRREFDRLIESKDSETLPESEVDRLIAEISSRTRTHPDIARGVSVRGTIAFKEILQGLTELQSRTTRGTINKAALIALPPRLAGRPSTDNAAVVTDIVKEVLYDLRFSAEREEAGSPIVLNWLSREDIAEGLRNLKPLAPGQEREPKPRESPTIIAEPGNNQEMLSYLESRKFLQKKGQNRYSLTRKALEYLMAELEQKLRAGEITPDEYYREKNRLTAMLKSVSQPQFRMSAKELANTIMELMDAQDRQWSGEMSFERMHIYYHIKANSNRDALSPQKRDYYGLKALVDDLAEQGILRATETADGFTLTGEALDTLLAYLIARVPGGRGLESNLDFGKVLLHERKPEIRRFTSGDIFRDISVRHTLREIARQKKGLSRVRRSDFRVFLRQYRQRQSDIVLCLDTSASMGSQYKLVYARLAATGVAKAAIASGDRVGVVTFDNLGQTTIPLTDKDDEAIIDYIVGLSARGNTNIADGIKCANQLLSEDRSHNQKHILLITDGQPTAVSQRDFARLQTVGEKDLTEESAILETRKAAARGIGVSVIHIATRDEASGKFVRSIARNGRGKIRRISSPEDLEAMMRR